MKKVLLICSLIVAAVLSAQDKMLFDFEQTKAPVKAVWNKEHAKAELSDKWASHGAKSLLIAGAAFDAEKMDVGYFPGVTLNLPLRDWSTYRYLQFDIRLEQDDLPLSFLIQYGKRWERISASYKFAKGTYRVKVNLHELIGEPALERLKNIAAFEFHVTRPKEDFTIYVDNIMLIAGSDSDALMYDSVTGLDAQNRPVALNPQKPLLPDAGLREMLSVLDKEFPGKEFGLKATSISESVPFRNAEISTNWSNRIDFTMAQNEKRSVQVVFFRKPVDKNTEFEVECKIDGIGTTVERIGYLDLLPFYSLEKQGFVPGWYPDPILKMAEKAPLEKEQWLQPLVLTMNTAKDAKPGNYSGTFTVKYQDKTVDMPILVKVAPVQMPDKPELPLLLGIGSFNGKADRQFWLDYRMNPHYSDSGNIYDKRQKTALNIDFVKQWVDKGMTVFNLIYVNRLDFKDVSEEAFMNSIYNKYTDDYMRKMAAAGIADRAIIYSFDEVTVSHSHQKERETVSRILGAFKERYGKYGVRTAATLRDCNDFSIHDMPVDIWIPLGNAMTPEAAEHLRSLGKEVWWYHIVWETWYPAAWTRSLHWTTMARKYQGWLYYNLNGPWSKKQSLGDSALTAWTGFSVPNLMMYGTGSLVYQDQEGLMRPSLRLINFREGMYDYDLATALKRKVEELSPVKQQLPPAKREALSRAVELINGTAWKKPFGELTDKPGSGNADPALFEKLRQDMLETLAKLI